MKERIAHLLSGLLDPVLVMPMVLLMMVWSAYSTGDSWRFLAIVLLLDALVPIGYLVHRFVVHGKQDWTINNHKDRMGVFMLVLMTHGLAVLGAFVLKRYLYVQLLFAIWLLVLVLALITWYWKISLHVSFNAMAAVLIHWFLGVGWFWVLPLAVGWARVQAGRHTPMQVLAGLLVPPVVLYGAFWGLGLGM